MMNAPVLWNKPPLAESCWLCRRRRLRTVRLPAFGTRSRGSTTRSQRSNHAMAGGDDRAGTPNFAVVDIAKRSLGDILHAL